MSSSASMTDAIGGAGAGTTGSGATQVAGDSPVGPCSFRRSISQPVMGPDTIAPTTTASVAAPTAISGACASPIAWASLAHAAAVPGPPTNETLPISKP